MRKIINALLIIVLAFAWYTLISRENLAESEFNRYLSTGDLFFKQEVYEEAIDNYKKALEINEDIAIKEKIIDSLIKEHKYEEVIKELNYGKYTDQFASTKQKFILDELLENENYKDFNYYLSFANSKLQEHYREKYFSEYIIYPYEYSNINYFPSDTKLYIAADIDIDYRLIDDKGSFVSADSYDYILNVDYPRYTAVDNNKIKVLNINRDLLSSLNKAKIFGINEDYLVKAVNGKYFYINRAGEQISPEYERASNFRNGIALVLNNGSVQILDKEFNLIKSLKGKSFKLNKRNDAIFNNRTIIFDNGYFIYDLDKENYSVKYEDINFDMGELIAFKKKGKWGYINQEFEEIIKPQYDEANSFSQGLGIVKKDNKYKIINNDNVVLKTLNNEIRPFSKEGISFIKVDEKWKMIKLMRYIND